jgi:serine/threonine-protein kinase
MMMEFVQGSTLEQIAKQGPIPQSDVVNYMQQVLAALSYAHSRGVVHRDIKPANIMVTSQGVVKLMDFGIAKSRTEQDLTRPGTTMGSLYYMSPEQVRGGTVDARSDIYSVGVMMYELLAGRRPFVADSAYEILNQQCNVVPQPPLEVNAQLPPPLSDIIVCAMAKDPANRFQNAQALSNALRQVAAMQSDPAKREEVAYTPVAVPGAAQPAAQGVPAVVAAPLVQPSSGHRGVWMTVGALAVLVVVACAAIGLPRLLHTSAKTESDGATQTSPPAPSTANPEPASTVPSGTVAASDAGAPAATPPAADAKSTPLSAADNPPQTPVPPGTEKSIRPKNEVIAKSPRPDYHPAAQADVAIQADSTKQPASTGPSAEEVEQVHEQMTGLDARASAVSASVEGLKRQQEAEGLGLRRDMAAAYARMNTYLRSANDELNGGNITAARSHMDKADKEISTLESFLGK